MGVWVNNENYLEVIKMVKENIHSYESTSLANDDVERLLRVIDIIQEENRELKEEIEKLKQSKKRGSNWVDTSDSEYRWKQLGGSW